MTERIGIHRYSDHDGLHLVARPHGRDLPPNVGTLVPVQYPEGTEALSNPDDVTTIRDLTTENARLRAQVDRLKEALTLSEDGRIYDKSAMSWMLQLLRFPPLWLHLRAEQRTKVEAVKAEYEREAREMTAAGLPERTSGH